MEERTGIASTARPALWRRAGRWLWERVQESPESLLALFAGSVIFVLGIFDVAGTGDLAKATLGVLVVLAFSLMRLRSVRTEFEMRVASTESIDRLREAVEAIESATPWRVLNTEIEWAITTRDGSKATCKKKRELEFYQNEVMALNDLADPSGGTVKHECTPGTVISAPVIRSGGEPNVLIALPRAYQRGEKETFEILRELKDKFPATQESVTFKALEDTNRVVLRVVWPHDRKPTKVWVTRMLPSGVENVDLRRLVDEGDTGWSLTLDPILQPPRGDVIDVEWIW